MADTGKRKISAKEIVADVRAGMDDAQIQRKHGLSEEALESVFDKLMNAGAITEAEIRNRGASAGREEPVDEGKGKDESQVCPACNASVPSRSDECPKCGIVLSKFLTTQGQTDAIPLDIAHFSQAESEGSSRWLTVGLSIVVLALIGVSVVIWAMHRDKQKLQDVSTDTKPVLEQVGSPADTSKEVSSEDSPVEVNPDEESTAVEADEPAAESGGIQTPEATLEEPTEQVSDSPQPVEKPSSPPADKAAYVTGELRRFTIRDFKKEVVEASRTYPVIFQFYSDT